MASLADEIAGLRQRSFAECSDADRVWELFDRMRLALQTIAKNNTDDCEIYTMGCDCHEVAQEGLK